MPTSKALAAPNVFRRIYDAIVGKPARADRWENWVTGAGTWGRDKSTHTFFSPICLLSWGEIESLYYGDWCSAKLVNARPDEYFRRPFELESSDKDALEKALKVLGARAKMQDGTIYARAWGGAGLVCGVDDGQTVDQPVNFDRARGIKFINVVDRRYLTPMAFYDDPSEANFGQPRLFQLTPAFGQSVTNTLIHESRIIRFQGSKVDPITARRLAGWSYSALQRPYDVLRRIAQAFQAAGQLMYDASQGVLKVSNLFDQLTGKSQAAVLDRIAQADMSRWSGRLIAVDKDGEDFERVATSFAGVPDIMDRLFLELSGAADAPLTRIFGRSPAGQNATGESDDRMWYESIARDQQTIIEPAIERLLMMMTRGKWSGKITFPSLQQPDDLKDAQIEQAIATKWKTYVDAEIVSAEQAAMIQFLGKQPEDVLDEDALEQIIEAETEFAEETAKNPPPDPPALPPSNGSPMPPQLPPAPASVPSPAKKRDRKKRADHIVERGGKYFLMSKKDPTKQLGGPYDTRAQAEERERQVIAAEAAKGE